MSVEEGNVERHKNLVHADAGGRWSRGVKDEQGSIETAQRRHAAKALSERHAHDAEVPVADRNGFDR
ncbi:MAG TPA: hypothetical protein VFR14_10230 [Candidatus Limnocylindrales bacterium]|nr:hypothetical protein [Candidatus Limnocylindrales bacterium]